jgi:hypothetical protein
VPRRCVSVRWKGWASPAEGLNEFFLRDFRLAQHAGKCADLNFAVHRHDATFRLATHDDVATALAQLCEPKTLKRANDLRA